MTYRRQTMPTGSTTPNIEKSEGVRPAQHFVAAPYLPLVRLDAKLGDYVTISYGKVIAADLKNNHIVPAGLIKDLEYALAFSWDVDGDATSLLAQAIVDTANYGNVYTATDVAEGILNWAGDAVTAGEPVVVSMLKSGAIDYKTADPATAVAVVGATAGFSSPLGMAPYNVWRQNGAGFAGNPTNYNYTNWNLQQGVSVLTRYFIELPVTTTSSQAVFPGLTVFETSSNPQPGDLVTFNKNSNWTIMSPLAASTFAAAAAGDPTDAEVKAESDVLRSAINDRAENVLGKIYFVDTDLPKDYLEYVRTYTASVPSTTALDKVPGSATNGLPDNVAYAGTNAVSQKKLVRINFMVK